MRRAFKKKKLPQPRSFRSQAMRPVDNLPTAFSYHAKRSTSMGKKITGRQVTTIELDNKKNKILKARLVAVVSGLVLLVIIAVAELGVSTNARIVLIEPKGFSYQPHTMAQYQTAAKSAISASIYNRFKTSLSSYDISQAIKQEFPEVSYAAVSVSLFGSTPTVYIQLSKPVLIYQTSQGSFALDNKGIVIADQSSINTQQLAQLPTIQAPSGSIIHDGDQLLTAQNVNFIQTVSQGLSVKGLVISKMILAPAAEELDVYIAKQPYYVKFNIYQSDVLQQLGTYLAAVATLKQQNKIATQYIDVRVDGRAYYK